MRGHSDIIYFSSRGHISSQVNFGLFTFGLEVGFSHKATGISIYLADHYFVLHSRS